MALSPPTPGLHRFRNNSKQVAKVDIRVQPGDELDVSADVAAQLEAASGAFRPAEGLDPFPVLNSEPDAGDPGLEPVKKKARKVVKKAAPPSDG